MPKRLTHMVHTALERRFPERRLFLKSDSETRFIRLRPGMQLIAWTGVSLTLAWTIVASAILLMDNIGAGNVRAQAERDRQVYEDRLNALASERDMRAAEAAAAQQRFASALQQVSVMQSELLGSEDRRREMETGLEVVQATLRRAILERETAEARIAELDAVEGGALAAAADESTLAQLDILADALAETAAQRDAMAQDADLAGDQAAELQLELRLTNERTAEIFEQLEEAMEVSVEPLNEMFRAAGMDPDNMIRTVRRGYNGVGGPLTPLSYSTMGGGADPVTDRANAILNKLDDINLYRIAAEKAPFSMPVLDRYRISSTFGSRWGRMHEGVDMAAPTGTPIYATADGVIIQAGWASGYGRLIKIQHEFGIETRYGHLSEIDVQVGQRVSRGDHIGDMGSTGRSTGPHLHYEVRVGGTPVNPMTYIRAGQDVF
ncbi:M23 family metallopeptidase [Pseudoroseicyclus aestuarii]|uniref:Murein DD-endopeptidase MepM/ murein hydrolase activator NlpD n=1 Tax=Pseudoroseicyclus aestuarii TaxID=1795041 RepID=A0A318SWB1_9RHOB|nr:M23 family metallopeptidase [Pseudoroseicyclus aestuarii]PYE85792.1 murein DD-endopeptidase MepM/ murein hydrolase activator NlpD [Pseudoroseicyclus aestuarii]